MAWTAHYVERILDGARPADLPMEQPTRFYLTLNLRPARAGTTADHGRRGDRMRRRELVTVLGGASLAWPLVARAQQQPRASPVTILVVGAVPANLAPQGLRRGLEELGYVEGRDLAIQFYAGESAGLAAELVQRRIDVVFAVASHGVVAAQRASRTVPIVALDLESEPVADGLVSSFARPGGNLTGFFLDQPALAGKWLQLVTEVAPGASRLAVLRDPRLVAGQWRAVESAARRMGLEFHAFELSAATLERVFGDIAGFDPHALVILSSPIVVPNCATIATLAAKARLPSITMFRLYAEAGGLMSYGPSPYPLGLRAARYVDKILKGTRPGDLPVEQPTTFDLAINMRTAKALGLTIPPAILALADEVID